MIFKSNIFFETTETTDKVKQRIRSAYEAGDILKHEEFRKASKNYTTAQIKGLRLITINDPNIHYVGNYSQGNFNLRSPRLSYWNRVTLFVFPRPVGARVSLEVDFFRIIFIPLIIGNLAGILFLFQSISAGLSILIFTVPLMIFFSVKLNNTIRYFEQKIK